MNHFVLCLAALLASAALLTGCTDKGNVSDSPNGIIESSTQEATPSTTAQAHTREDSGSIATTVSEPTQDTTSADAPARSRDRKTIR